MSAICPPPFALLDDFPETGGYIKGRFCSQLPINGTPTCCLPCPQQNYFYPDNFETLIEASSYMNLAGVILCCFLLFSFAVLPVEYTHRHYLSVCLVLSILIMEVAFVIPLGSSETQCYNKITPQDMTSSASCAVSGALVLGGGWCVACWIFLRTLSLHLQICWQMIPGRKFFLCAQAAGWSIPVALVAVALSITGVSFRFGNSCHINSNQGLATAWGPLLAVAAASIVTQFITFGYCIQVYLKSLFDEKRTTTTYSTQSHLPYSNSISTVTPAQAFRRIQRVFALQWKGILVVIIILTDVIFFATVFLRFDGITEKAQEDGATQLKWVECIIENNGDKNACLDVAKKLVLSEATALSVLFLLSCNGLWAMLLLGPISIFPGWWHMIKKLFRKEKPGDEFVSYHARGISETEPSYEMLSGPDKGETITLAPVDSSPVVKRPEPVSIPKTQEYAPRVYDPSNFSIRSEIYSPPGSYSPYHDLDSFSRSPPTTSPYSQTGDYINYPHRSHSLASYQPTRTNSAVSIPVSPFRDHQRGLSRSSSNFSVPHSSIHDHRRQVSHTSTASDVSTEDKPGPSIGVAQ